MPLMPLIELDRCPIGRGTFTALGCTELAVFRLADPDRIVVADNACPHASGNLAAGKLSGCIVQCPWHHWEFDLERGVCVNSERVYIRRYPSRVREGVIYVDPSSPIRVTTVQDGNLSRNGDCSALEPHAGEPSRACSSAVRAGDS